MGGGRREGRVPRAARDNDTKTRALQAHRAMLIGATREASEPILCGRDVWWSRPLTDTFRAHFGKWGSRFTLTDTFLSVERHIASLDIDLSELVRHTLELPNTGVASPSEHPDGG